MTTYYVRSLFFAIAVLSVAWPSAGGAEPQATPPVVDSQGAKQSRQGTSKALHAARKSGWVAISQVIPVLEESDAKTFPGIAAWVKDFRKSTEGMDTEAVSSQWPAFDVDAIVTNNSNYWRAHYEVAPGDPAIVMLHGALLMLGSEPQRASYVLLVGLQRPGIPAPIRDIMQRLAAQSAQSLNESNRATHEGIKLFDQGKLAEALQKHKEALDLCPQNGFAHYEWGLTQRQQEWKAAGIVPETNDGKVLINKALPASKEVAAAFARARRHDPFQWKAYQGDNKDTIDGLMILLKKGMPNWEKLTKTQPKMVEDQVLVGLGEGLQGARQDDLALLVRQVVIARRGRFAPEDHPYIGTSLRRMAPGENVEKMLDRLAGKELAFRQIIAPEKAEVAP